MTKNIKNLLIVIGAALLVVGCKTAGVEVRGYVQDRARVDQETAGNSGFLAGSVKEKESPKVPTRKVVVVEVSKETKIKTIKKSQTEETKKIEEATENVAENMGEDETSLDDSEQNQAIVEFQEYKVEKDDTLQKISKKFYDSYTKWPQIYEANKGILKSPDNLKPGMKLMIPTEKK